MKRITPSSIGVLLAVAGLAWFLFRPLSLEWEINPQYSYGWVVPALALYLFVERWRDRPVAEGGGAHSWLFAMLLIVLGVVRLAQEANPDWRLLSWLGAFTVVGLFWLGLARAGGRAWLRHFGFASGFILVATPWPTPVENVLVQSLMRGVAAVTVEFLNWGGIAAQQEGNLIRLAGATLGIDEACSGVRSFQATMMAALFLGELQRLDWRRRAGLVVIGVGLALGLNMVRALLLAVVASREGSGAVDRWHDPAGYLLLAGTFFGLLGVARALGREKKPETPHVGEGQGSCALGAASVIVVAWLVVCEVGTRAWYRAHETGAVTAKWKVKWPYGEGNFLRAPIAENVRLILRYNNGEAARWIKADGSQWDLFFFGWKPGRAAAALARSHRPETCLPATGFEFAEDRGAKMHRVAGLELPVERLEFKHQERLWHVYYCLWEDRVSRGRGGVLTRAERVRAVLEGRRHLGQRVLEVVISGVDSSERADEQFAEALSKWVVLE